MKWSDVKDGVWTIATEKREKGNAGSLRLPPVALDIIAAQDEVVGNLSSFPATNGRGGTRPPTGRGHPASTDGARVRSSSTRGCPRRCLTGPSTTCGARPGR